MPGRPPPNPSSPPPAAGRPFRVSALARNRAHPFALQHDAAARRALAEELGLLALRKLAFAGRLEPEGRDGWRLVADLGATVVQPCVATGAPVTTRIDTPVLRRYLTGPVEPQVAEVEVPEDDSVEPLGTSIDPAEVLREALSLALPDYPRAADAPEPGPGPGPEPSPEPGAGARSGASPPERPNPFAALARLQTDAKAGKGGGGSAPG